ncbi:MAG TPA: glycosyltransferase [Methylorubrum populi]|uniref:Glycosyltransferase n=1 Tax=Methylorubrum populi TaxID=223967 RepID=A0A921E3L2_9HYPH|nr:glycosyltransferase [Methylorubrum populi]
MSLVGKVTIRKGCVFSSRSYRKLNDDLAFETEQEGIQHFFLRGIAELRRFEPEIDFDPDFYTSYYAEAEELTAAEAYDHWLRIGVQEGYAANGPEMIEQATGLVVADFPADFQVTAYAFMAGLKPANRWGCLEHFIRHGAFSLEAIEAADLDADFLLKIGQALEPQEAKLAIRCYQAAIAAGKQTALIHHGLGDVYFKEKQYFEAYSHYRQALSLDRAYIWTVLNCAECASQIGLHEEAVALALQARTLLPNEYYVRQAVETVARRRFAKLWSAASRHSFCEQGPQASALIEQAVTGFEAALLAFGNGEPDPVPLEPGGFRTAIIGSDHVPQCKFYRIDQKVDQLRASKHEAAVYTLQQADELTNELIFFDAVIVHRAPATPEIVKLLHRCRRYAIPTFYDIDDLIFDEGCYPPSRASLEGMVTAREYAELSVGRDLFRAALARCDFGIASTPAIRERLAKAVRSKAFLHRNALSKAHLRAKAAGTGSKRKHSDEVLLFYGSGGRSHNENFQMIGPAIARVMTRYPQTRLRIVGPLELGPELDPHRAHIEHLPFTGDLEVYWSLLEEADVNLAPLTAGDFTDAKSEVKWIEAALFRIPSIVSATATYRDCINQGVDGWTAARLEEWEDALERLVTDAVLRGRMADAAHDRVSREYALTSKGAELLDLLRQGFDERRRAEPPMPARRKPLILIVNVFYPPQFIGGATRIVEQNLRYLRDHAEEFDVEVVCARDSGGAEGQVERYAWDGVTVTSFAPFADASFDERSAKTEAWFERLFDRLKPDLIHFHCMQRITASALDAAQSRDIPYLVTAHDGWWISDRQFLIDQEGRPVPETGEWGDRKRLSRLRSALRRSAGTLAVSDFLGRLYESRGIDNIVVCPNGIEQLPDIPYPPATSRLCLGLLGGLGMAKGSDLLRTALKSRAFGHLHFLIVDHAAPQGSVRFERWGENEVEIVGKTSFDDVAAIYARLHGVLAISVCVESFGLVAHEAASLGRWVVASDRGGVGACVQDGVNGWVIDVSSPWALTQVLDDMNSRPDRFRAPAPIVAPMRTWRQQAREVVDLYRDVLAPSRDAASGARDGR